MEGAGCGHDCSGTACGAGAVMMGLVDGGCERSVCVWGVRPARMERTDARSGVALDDMVF